MPNDEHENDRLDMHHHLATIMLRGRLHVVPLEENMPVRVLDVGTGTGIWAVEMGQFDISAYFNCHSSQLIFSERRHISSSRGM